MNFFISDAEIKEMEDWLGETITNKDRNTISAQANTIYNAIMNPKTAKKLAIAMALYKTAYTGDIDIESDTACDYQDSVVNSI